MVIGVVLPENRKKGDERNQRKNIRTLQGIFTVINFIYDDVITTKKEVKNMVEIEGYNLPEELYYTKDHTWARVEDSGSVTIGMDAYGAKAAGNIEFIDLPMEDDEFESGEAFGSLESAKWVGGLLMPVGGTVIAVNENIEDELDLLSKDPYSEGWLIKIKPGNLKDDLKALVHGNDVGPWLKKEIETRKKK